MDRALWGAIALLLFLAVYWPLLPDAARAYRRLRGRKSLLCPESGNVTRVQIGAARAALTALFSGRPALRVRDCARWQVRRGCREGCLAQVA